MRISIDVGGTFTDVVLIEDASGQIHYTKVLTTHHNLAEGVIAGIDRILERCPEPVEGMARQRRKARTPYSVTCNAFLVTKSTVLLRTKGSLG